MSFQFNSNSSDTLMVAQVGALRIIGMRIKHETQENQTKNIPLYNVGAIITQRAVVPGQIAGTVNMTKSVSIVPIDFTTGPIKKMLVNSDMTYTIDEEHVDPKDIETFIAQYNLFLKSEHPDIQPRLG